MSDKFIEEKARKIQVIKNVNVIVAGGGVAGLSAAISSAREGVKTLLVEQYGFLGGTATTVPMNWFGGYVPALHKGIIKEVIDRLKKKDGIGKQFFNPINNGYLIEFSVDIFKEVVLQMLEEAGAELLLHAWIADSIVKNNKIKGVIIETKSGRQAIVGDIVVDATGDGDVAVRAGCSYQKGRETDGKTQGMTLVGPIMEKVDNKKLWNFLCRYKKEHPKELVDFVDDRLPFFVVSGFPTLLKRARDRGDLYLDYDTIWINGTLGTDKAEIGGSFVRADGTDVFDLTYAEVESTKQLSSIVNFAKKYIPGFENSHRTDRGSVSIGVRETRRIMGEYVLTKEDILAGRKFPDAIAKNKAPMDVHSPEGQKYTTLKKSYDIPYRCLVPEKIDNLLVAGRCISVTHEALASARFIPCCMATGQAAGVASALSIKNNTSPRKLNVVELQKVLRKQKVVI